MLFEQCPQLYKDRYVDGIATDPSLPMLFGSAVHIALEAMHQGHRGVCLTPDGGEDHYKIGRAVYTEQFDLMAARLAELPQPVMATASLYNEGLRMLDLVSNMKLNADQQSEPERWFTLPTGARATPSSSSYDWGMPTIGAVDLWSPPWSQHGAVIFDFKTTLGSWSQARAEKEMWQPMLYTWAYRRAYDVIPTFRYVVLSRSNGTVQVFDRTWANQRTWNDDLAGLLFRADAIAEAVQNGNFACTKAHGSCLECGRSYGHHHVCQDGARPNKIKLQRGREAPTAPTWVQPALNLA